MGWTVLISSLSCIKKATCCSLHWAIYPWHVDLDQWQHSYQSSSSPSIHFQALSTLNDPCSPVYLQLRAMTGRQLSWQHFTAVDGEFASGDASSCWMPSHGLGGCLGCPQSTGKKEAGNNEGLETGCGHTRSNTPAVSTNKGRRGSETKPHTMRRRRPRHDTESSISSTQWSFCAWNWNKPPAGIRLTKTRRCGRVSRIKDAANENVSLVSETGRCEMTFLDAFATHADRF